jgi:predicted RNA binding protein YcfA (HicA-like mRNA interferase family)
MAEDLGMPVKVGEMIKTIEADGWFLARIKGSHRQFHHPVKPGTVTVSGKLSTDLPIGTERSILRQAGISGRKA